MSGTRKSAADLDEFAAGNHDLASTCVRGQHEQHGRGVVVDDHPGFGAATAGQQAPCMIVARAPPAGFEHVLEIGSVGDCGDGANCIGRERGPTEVGVQQHSGRVHDPLQQTALLRSRKTPG